MTGRLAIGLMLLSGPAASAQDPELIPLKPTVSPPAMVLQPAHPTFESVSFVRQSFYDRWQYYSVDRHGYFRPRVVLDPVMPYYLANGRPYPLLPVQPQTYIKYILD
jgi:hypothetical protein